MAFRSSASQGQFRNPIQAADKATADKRRDDDTIRDAKEDRQTRRQRDLGFLDAMMASMEKSTASARKAHDLQHKWKHESNQIALKNWQAKADQADRAAQNAGKVAQAFAELAPSLAESYETFKGKRIEAESKEWWNIQASSGLSHQDLITLRTQGLTLDQLSKSSSAKLKDLYYKTQKLTAKQYNNLMSSSGGYGQAFEKFDVIEKHRGVSSWVNSAINSGVTVQVGTNSDGSPIEATVSDILYSKKYNLQQLNTGIDAVKRMWREQSGLLDYNVSFANSPDNGSRASESYFTRLEASAVMRDEAINKATAKENDTRELLAAFPSNMQNVEKAWRDYMFGTPKGTEASRRDLAVKHFIEYIDTGAYDASQIGALLDSTVVVNGVPKTFKQHFGGHAAQLEDALLKRQQKVNTKFSINQTRIKNEEEEEFQAIRLELRGMPETEVPNFIQDQYDAAMREGKDHKAKQLIRYLNTDSTADNVFNNIAKNNLEAIRLKQGYITEDDLLRSGFVGTELIKQERALAEAMETDPERTKYIKLAKSDVQKVINKAFKETTPLGESSHPQSGQATEQAMKIFLRLYNAEVASGSGNSEKAYSAAMEQTHELLTKAFSNENHPLFIPKESKKQGEIELEAWMPNLGADFSQPLTDKLKAAKSQHGDDYLEHVQVFNEPQLDSIHRAISTEGTNIPNDIQSTVYRIAEDDVSRTPDQVYRELLENSGRKVPDVLKEKTEAQGQLSSRDQAVIKNPHLNSEQKRVELMSNNGESRDFNHMSEAARRITTPGLVSDFNPWNDPDGNHGSGDSWPNAHGDFAFNTREEAVVAYIALKEAGVEVTEFLGYSDVNQVHVEGSGHYTGTKFDIPFAQWGSGPLSDNDRQQYKRVQDIVRQALLDYHGAEV